MKSSGQALSAMALMVLIFLTACNNGTPRLQSISINPSTVTITQSAPAAAGRTHAHSAVLDQQQFTATGLFGNGSTTDISSQVTWSSSSTSVATISATGLATAVGPGTTTITATLMGVSGTATLTVTTVVSVAVTPVNPTIAGSGTQQFVATATITNADGSTGTMDVSSDPNTTWTSGTPAVATIDASGLATGVSQGSSLITAAFGGASGSTTLTVGVGPISLVLTPATQTVAVSNTVAFKVQEKWSDNTLHKPSGAVTFSSGTTATATVNATSGVALAVGVGTSTITATEGTLTGTATLTVSAANARFAYVANTGDGTIGEYSVDAATGTFTALTPVSVTPSTPQQVIVDPNGLYVYCICDTGTTEVDLYKVNPVTGALVASSPLITTSIGLSAPARGVMDPTGQFMFVIDGNANKVFSFSVSQIDGSLTAVNSQPTGTNPYDVLIDHTGKHLYVVNQTDSTVSQYSIASDGTLQPPTTPVKTGPTPVFSTIDPTNTYLYVPNNGDSTLSIFTIGSDGSLTAQTPAPITGATSVGNVAVDPTNKYIYVMESPGSGTGSLYGYNTGTGALGTALNGSPYLLATTSTDGLSPMGIAIDPTGTLVAVDNNFSADISLLKATAGVLALSTSSPAAAGNAPAFVVFYIAP